MNLEALSQDVETDLESVTVTLKWFNSTKGFGFVVPNEDPCDAFIHITTLQQADIHALGEGAELICDIVKGPKGALVTKVIELARQGEDPAPLSQRVDEEQEEISTMNGTVKWYKPDKGFGFIIPEDGEKDVFVHQSCLDKHGMSILIPGQKVTMKVRSVPKGREALDFQIIE